MFVPHTPLIALIRKLHEIKDKIIMVKVTKRLMIIERREDKFIDRLSKADPWERNNVCLKKDCLGYINIEDEIDTNNVGHDRETRIRRWGIENMTYVIASKIFWGKYYYSFPLEAQTYRI